MRERLGGPWIPALIAGAAVLVYLNTLWAKFVYDDLWTIVNDPFIKDLDNLWPLLTGNIPAGSVEKIQYVDLQWRPFMVLTTFLDYHVWGMRAFGWHLQNLLWHAGCSVLVGALAHRLASDRRVGLIAGLLFAVHAVHTEAVASINYREDLIVTFGVVAALLGAVATRRDGRWRHLGLGCLALALAANAKATSVTAPVLLAAYVVLFRGGSLRESIRRNLPALVAVSIASVASRRWYMVLAGGEALGYDGGSHRSLPPAQMLLTQAKIWLAYIGQHLLPLGLNADYTPRASTSLWEPAVAGGLLVVLGLVTLAVVGRRRWPLLAFGIAWFVITLLPTSGIVAVPNLRADRYLYLPSVGYCLVAGWALSAAHSWARARWPRSRIGRPSALLAGLAIVASIHGGLTVARNRVWHDDLSLWSRTAADSPRSLRAQAALMSAYQRRQRNAEALEVGHRALELDPDDWRLHMNLGIALSGLERHDEAIASFEHALRLRGAEAPLVNNLAYAHHASGDSGRAITMLEDGIRRWPNHARLHYNLGRILHETGEHRGAIAALRTAVGLLPHNVRALVFMGKSHLALGDHEAAAAAAERARRLRPEDEDLAELLAALQR